MDLFELNLVKWIFLFSGADLAPDMARTEKERHVATYDTATCLTRVHVRAYESAHVYACVCVCD